MRQAAATREEISRCVIALLLKEPFFGHLLGGVSRHITDRIPTAGVALTNSGVQLWVNPTFFLKTLRSRGERTAVIKHEVLHLLFKHLFRIERSNHARLQALAIDLVVNQYVAPWPLPDSGVTLATFPDLGLAPDKAWEWYYNKLAQLLPNSAGRGGSANAGTGARTGGPQAAASPRSAQALEDILGGGPSHSDHSQWAHEEGAGSAAGASEPAGLSTALREAMELDVERLITQAKERSGAQQWGRLPGHLRSLLNAYLEARKPKVNWRRALRLFSSSSRRTRIATTSRRMSKRYDTYPGIKIKRYQRMAVAIDTSGSIGQEELNLFFAEVHGMWRQGADVDVIECDAQVQHVWSYRGRLPDELHGGGGTAFDPVFAWLHKQRRITYDACIYLTDGHAAGPQIKPPCKLLWVVTREGNAGKHLRYGRMLRLD